MNGSPKSRETPGCSNCAPSLPANGPDSQAQVADYTAAIESLAQQNTRGRGRRSQAALSAAGATPISPCSSGRQAIDDYARGITDATTDEALLSNQALALAESLLLPDVPGVNTLVSTSENERMKWHFTTEEPAEEWAQPDFNDSKWQVGMGPFGTANVESAHTAWLTTDIWLRRSFEFPNAKNVESLFLRVNCDDDAQVFLNGTPVARRQLWTDQQFLIIELGHHVRDLIVPGRNIVAVHCKNTDHPGWGYIDVGLYAATERSLALTKQRLAALLISDPLTRLAAAYQIRGDQRAIDQLVARRPKLAGPVGDLFAQDKDWRRAIALYSQGITQKTTDVDLLSKRARAHEALQSWDAAAADWSRATTGNPDRAKLLAEFARRLAAGGQVPLAKAQFEESQALYERMLEAEPENDRQAWKELGIVRAELGQPEEAAAAFTKLMELTPDSRDESLWWWPDPAGINEALAAHDEIFGRVVQARPRNRTLLIARFHYFGRRRRWREAAEMAARIVELDPQDGQARQFRRALLLFIGDLEGYRRAIREELAALNERTPIAVGWLETLGQYEFSRADATGPPPQNEWESLSRGINDYREGRYAGAIRQLTEVTRPSAHPLARTLAHIFLAMAHQRLGQMAEAGRELDAVRKGLDGLGGVALWRPGIQPRGN